jgi:hypothetical protein
VAYTQAQMLADFRDHLGDYNSNTWTDYMLIAALRRAYEMAWPDWYAEIRDDATYTGYASLPAGTLSVPVPSALVGGKIYNIFGRVNAYQQGTDFSFTVGGSYLITTSPSSLTANQQVQLDGPLPTGLSKQTPYYVILTANRSFPAQSTIGGGPIIVPLDYGWTVGTPVVFTGSIPISYAANTVYYITTANPTSIVLSATPGGAVITSGSNTNTTIMMAGFQLAATPGTSSGAAITPTSSGSGYLGNYVDQTTDYVPFNLWTRGVRIDPLTESSPRIRFTSRDMTTFELRIEGAAQLSYPYVTVSAAGTNTFTVTGSSTGTTYTPTNNDTVFFWATAPVSFTSGGLGVGGLTPYYVVNASGSTFRLSATSGGSAITTTSTGSFNIYPGSQTLTGTDYTWFTSFLRYQGEVNAREGKQRSGNLDRRSMAQRRLLAQQDVIEARKHRMQPSMGSQFRWDG